MSFRTFLFPLQSATKIHICRQIGQLYCHLDVGVLNCLHAFKLSGQDGNIFVDCVLLPWAEVRYMLA